MLVTKDMNPEPQVMGYAPVSEGFLVFGFCSNAQMLKVRKVLTHHEYL